MGLLEVKEEDQVGEAMGGVAEGGYRGIKGLSCAQRMERHEKSIAMASKKVGRIANFERLASSNDTQRACLL